MTGTLLSNRRNTRENLLMYFYSREFLGSDTAFSGEDPKVFLDSVIEIKREDKLENIRDTLKEIFDNVKITKLDPGDVIEFQLPTIKEKISMTFEDMDNSNVADGFLSASMSIYKKHRIKEDEQPETDILKEKNENLKFFSSCIKYYNENLSSIDDDIKSNLENWDFGRISIIDKIILRMGIIELRYFSEIPPKVTINEAIELGKKYSTEKSNIFINGILNRLKDILRKSENLN
ncbi:MAG TPA: transcription antitermination factor NusB [Clostridiales bacterium]|jgi:transcription antitermination factor NusB|nr:transcription antitermination factor NusB [Clostridiales bacterium]HQP69235.1 transcription antitermination factor NusB [Clostridiales bacterium]